MGKDIKLRITAAENGGIVMYPLSDHTPASKANEIPRQPPLYIVPKVDPKSIGETVLAIMATRALTPESVDLDDIDF